ncbi:hypothetical protein CISIN_1g033871mg [Citrus sinensis]|uniref:Uncharacterized protein n=1 Tax=Citrus sinensis TaxID=2711 RepID=A0A067GH06_CITSI|nr:hypothetical protein CISIN_1g033871mg [Citrus sinensis]
MEASLTEHCRAWDLKALPLFTTPRQGAIKRTFSPLCHSLLTNKNERKSLALCLSLFPTPSLTVMLMLCYCHQFPFSTSISSMFRVSIRLRCMHVLPFKYMYNSFRHLLSS